MLIDLNTNFEERYLSESDPAHRRLLGQIFTPIRIASLMSEWILGNKKKHLDILDPAAGFSIFSRAIIQASNKHDLTFHIWEIDSAIVPDLREIHQELRMPAIIHNEDFLRSGWSQKYDGIIANPPYFKHHFIKEKESIHLDIKKNTGHSFSLQTNIYCLFLIKCLNQLKDDGRLAFIIPSEFLNSNYGVAVKRFLISLDFVINIVSFDTSLSIFDEASTTSCILLIEKKLNDSKINFYYASKVGSNGSLESLLSSSPKKSLPSTSLREQDKWKKYFSKEDSDEHSDALIPLKRLGKFSRGIATGANEYFTVSKEYAEEAALENECLLPCITKASFAKGYSFNNTDFTELVKKNKRTFLFDATARSSSAVDDYLEKGKAQGIHNRYLTRKRNPWFRVEKRSTSKIWAGVFIRGESKFIWNDSDCINLTCFHAFQPSVEGEGYEDILFLFLCSKTGRLSVNKELREYGDGLKKLEPSDLNKTLVLDPRYIPQEALRQLRELHSILVSKQSNAQQDALQKADTIFRSLV